MPTNENRIVTAYDDDTLTVNSLNLSNGKASSRPYTPEEVQEMEMRLQQEQALENETVLNNPVAVDNKISMLLALVDRESTLVPTGITEISSMQHLLNASNNTLNNDFPSNAGRYLKFIVRNEVRLANALVLALRLAGHRYNSTEIGE